MNILEAFCFALAGIIGICWAMPAAFSMIEQYLKRKLSVKTIYISLFIVGMIGFIIMMALLIALSIQGYNEFG